MASAFQSQLLSLVVEGDLRPLPRPSRRAARGRVRVAARVPVALRQGLARPAARGPVADAGAVGVRPRARAGDACSRSTGRPDAAQARAGRRPARLARAADVRDRLAALAPPATSGPSARRVARRCDPVRERAGVTTSSPRSYRLRRPQRAAVRDRAARVHPRGLARRRSALGSCRSSSRQPRDPRRPLVHRRRVPAPDAARRAGRRLAARRRAARAPTSRSLREQLLDALGRRVRRAEPAARHRRAARTSSSARRSRRPQRLAGRRVARPGAASARLDRRRLRGRRAAPRARSTAWPTTSASSRCWCSSRTIEPLGRASATGRSTSGGRAPRPPARHPLRRLGRGTR